jgi:indole-3-glycerol phosphate synthase
MQVIPKNGGILFMQWIDKIITYKEREIEKEKCTLSLKKIQNSPFFYKECLSLIQAIDNGTNGIIPEFQRQSPFGSSLVVDLNTAKITQEFEGTGILAMSVYTDKYCFGGSWEDLLSAKTYGTVPIICKDFFIDEWQIFMAKALGADVVFLKSEILTRKSIESLKYFAEELGMEVIVGISSTEDLSKLPDDIQLLAVDHLDIRTSEIHLNQADALLAHLEEFPCILVSGGMKTASEIDKYLESGYDGIMVGDYFFSTQDPIGKCKSLVVEAEKIRVRRHLS